MAGGQARVRLTAGRVAAFACPPDKAQAFLWDSDTPTLALRATPTGRKTYVFEARLRGATIRKTIGTVADWKIEDAREDAQRLKVLIDKGTDPRELERDKATEAAAKATAAAARALTVGDVWPIYLANGRPKRRAAWKPRYKADLVKMANEGGTAKKRGGGVTRPGPLFPLLAMPLGDVNEDTLKTWFDREAVSGEHQATRALMMFRGFLRWCAGKTEYRSLVDRDAGKGAAIMEGLPASTNRTDALDAAQVAGWWAGVAQLPNPAASVYLRTLLLTGARREEVAAMKWADIDFRWKKLTLADKVGDTRIIPLTPYLGTILASLPRMKMADGSLSPFVFANTSAAGRISDTRASHAKALKSAGIDRLTIHGLRRIFSLLGEAAGAPAGAIAQVMGHQPSATAEGYRPRSVDALRPYLQQIEAHILQLADVEFKPDAESVALRPAA